MSRRWGMGELGPSGSDVLTLIGYKQTSNLAK